MQIIAQIIKMHADSSLIMYLLIYFYINKVKVMSYSKY